MPEIPDFPTSVTGDLLYATDVNDIRDAIRELAVDYGDKQPINGAAANPSRPRIIQQWVGLVTLKPPSYAKTTTDFTDARYWVKKQLAVVATSGDLYNAIDDKLPNYVSGGEATGLGKNSVTRQTYIATNLEEIDTQAKPPATTHLLAEGRIVYVFEMRTRGTPDIPVFVFCSLVPGASLKFAIITSTWAYGGNTVTANPCSGDGTGIDTTKTLTLNLFWPQTESPQFFPHTAGVVVAYMAYPAAIGGADGLLVGWRQIPVCSERYMVLQGDGAAGSTAVTGLVFNYTRGK